MWVSMSSAMAESLMLLPTLCDYHGILRMQSMGITHKEDINS